MDQNNHSWNDVEKILDILLELPESRRPEKLNELAETGTPLYLEVEKLMDAMDESDSFMEQPAARKATDFVQDWYDDAKNEFTRKMKGKKVGPYQLVEQLGMGGMGMVYLAERADGAFEQKVALKYVRSGMETGEILERFTREQKIMAMIQHENIARIYDAGHDEHGVPFLIMEFVDGTTITEYCEENKLSVKERLKLFIDVCETVYFAHQNLIVHRDLKPSNIFVTKEGKVKLLDFGVAKVMDDEISELTRTGSNFVSMAYAAPEQLENAAVNTGTDVYSLGVILYQLLSGELPYSLADSGLSDAHQKLKSERAEKPSTRIQKKAAVGAGITNEELTRLVKELRGDLDNIILKAMAKEPAERYDSLRAFADDIRRYLRNEPVIARKSSFLYRSRKFVKRNSVSVAASLFGVLLLAGAVFYHTSELQRERDQAEAQALRAEQVSGFLIETFQAANPQMMHGETLTAADLLAEGMSKADDLMLNQPEMATAMYMEMGRAWEAIGDYPKALEAFEKALNLREEMLPPDHPDIAEALHHRGMINLRFIPGENDPKDQFERALAIQRAAFGDNHRSVARSHWAFGMYYMSLQSWDKAAESYGKSADVQLVLVGEEHQDYLDALADRASALGFGGHTEEAIEIYREVMVHKEATMTLNNHSLVTTYNNFGLLLANSGYVEEGYEMLRKSYEGYQQIYGETHLNVGITSMTLANTLHRMEDFETGLEIITNGIDVMLANVAPNHPYLHTAYHSKGRHLEGLGDEERAEYYYRKSIRLIGEVRSPDHPTHAIPRKTLADLLLNQRRLDEARVITNEALESLFMRDNPSPAMVADHEFNLGRILFYEGNHDSAREYILRSAEHYETFNGTESAQYAMAQEYLERFS